MTARVRFDEGILTTTILPLAALAVGLFALFLAYRTPERAKPAGRASESITLVCMLLASGYAAWRWAPPAEHTGALLGLALGAVAVWIGGWLPDKSPNELRTAAFLGIGAAAAGALHLLPVKQAT
ncbi:MAG: hypothetical protein HY248_05360, partial [Fimbriimonas ginsengisoli]|nr:hypothetical protein [Fimbriimonas ginsengisoli]